MQWRFATLDGIRGIAALAVASGHASDCLPAGWSLGLVPNYPLAVDLFFLLSGFVLGHAYEGRFKAGMKARDFIALRLIRLYPLYLVGTFIAAASTLGALLVGQRQMLDLPSLVVALVCALLFLPSPTQWRTDSIAPLNHPSWSLIFELLANVIYATFYRRLTNAVLLAIVATSMLALIVAELRVGNLNGGLHWPTIGVGLARVGFGFPLGVLLFRILPARHIVSRWAYVVPFMVLPVFIIPVEVPAVVELPALFVVFPAAVAVGASIEPRAQQLFLKLGALSYALYIVHLPIVRIISRLAGMMHMPVGDSAPAPMIVVIAGLLAFCAWLHRHYDAPLGEMLKNRLVRRRQGDASATPPTAPATS